MLRILTFNTGLTEIRLFGAALYEDVPHVVPRAAHLAAALRTVGADLVLLQELVPQRVKLRLTASSAISTRTAPASPRTAASTAPGCSSSPATPMEDAACTAFAQQTLEEGLFGPRGMVACTVRAPGFGRLRVINLHATAGGAYRQHRRKGAPDRRSAQLAEAIEAAAAPFDGTVVLGGDFNCSPVTAPRVGTRLQEAGFVDAAAGLSRGTWDPDNPLNRDRARGPAHRVDHVFVRPGSGRHVTVADARIVLDEPVVRTRGQRGRYRSRTITAFSPPSPPPDAGRFRPRCRAA